MKKVAYRVDFVTVHHRTKFRSHICNIGNFTEGGHFVPPRYYKGPKSPVLVGLRNSVVCMTSHCDRVFICVKETSLQDEEVRIINVFQTYSPSTASYDKASQGRKYYLLIILFSPDNTTCTCNFCQDQMRKGLSERFCQFARFPYKVLRRKCFLKNALNE